MFPNTSTQNPDEVVEFITGIGGDAFVITDAMAAALEQGYSRTGDRSPNHAGDVHCGAVIGIGPEKNNSLHLAEWQVEPTASFLRQQPWWYYLREEFPPLGAKQGGKFPAFQTMDHFANVLVDRGYERANAANTLALYYNLLSAQLPPEWVLPKAANSKAVAFKFSAEVVQRVPAYNRWQRIEAYCLQIPVDVMAEHAARKIPWSLLRALYTHQA